MEKKKVTVGIPAFKAEKHICNCLASIQIQSMRDKIEVIIASDNPDDDYEFVKDRYPDLDITILDCEKNTGPGLARQRCLDACTTKWITFIDADDVFYAPYSIESLYSGIIPEAIEVQGIFLQEIENNEIKAMPINNPGHAWVFGRLYSVKFLNDNEIKFSELRAMEDGELNFKIRMLVEGTEQKIVTINEYVYLWRIGSEHSITRIGADDKDQIPQYNFDLCQIGGTIATIRAAKFCRERNPFNGNVTRFITEMMIDKYFTYVECLSKKPVFAEQNFFNAKRLYYESFQEIENQISKKVLSEMYTVIRGQRSQDLFGVIPEISFFEFMDKIKSEEYGGDEELKEIRAKLPKEIIENDIKTGVLNLE